MALQLNINMDAKNMQDKVAAQMTESIYLIATSLLSGNNVDVHCMAGCHRGGIIGVALRAIMMDQSFDAARVTVSQVRNVEVRKALAYYGPESVMTEWIRNVVTECQKSIRPILAEVAKKSVEMLLPQPVGWGFSDKSTYKYTHALVQDPQAQSKKLIPLCLFNQKTFSNSGFKDPTTTKEDSVAIKWGRELCKDCAGMLSAKWRVKAGFGPYSMKHMVIHDAETWATYKQYVT